MERIKRDWRTAGLGEADRALLAYAEQLTREPSAATEGALEELRRHGFADADLHDAVQIISYFNYINRIADGLGVDLEDFMAPRSAAHSGAGARGTEARP